MTCFHLEGRNCEVFDVLFSWVFVLLSMHESCCSGSLTYLVVVRSITRVHA
jgi:hypothetical protein